MKVLVIETINENEIEWGISFTDYNPELKDYVRTYSKEDAFKLCDILKSI